MMFISYFIGNLEDGFILMKLRLAVNSIYKNIILKNKIAGWSKETIQMGFEGVDGLKTTTDEMISFIEEDVDGLEKLKEALELGIKEGEFDTIIGRFSRYYYRFMIFVILKIYMRHYNILLDDVVPKVDSLMIKFKWSMLK